MPIKRPVAKKGYKYTSLHELGCNTASYCTSGREPKENVSNTGIYQMYM